MNKIKRLLLAFLACFLVLFSVPPSDAQVRTFNAPRQARRLLTKQFAAGANVFTIVDPSPAGTPLTLSSATGVSNMDGSATIGLNAGFTPPVTFTVYIWQQDTVTPANSCWRRISNNAAGYSQAVDANYTTIAFTIPENTPFIILSSAAVTGNVYTDAPASIYNNTVAGY